MPATVLPTVAWRCRFIISKMYAGNRDHAPDADEIGMTPTRYWAASSGLEEGPLCVDRRDLGPAWPSPADEAERIAGMVRRGEGSAAESTSRARRRTATRFCRQVPPTPAYSAFGAMGLRLFGPRRVHRLCCTPRSAARICASGADPKPHNALTVLAWWHFAAVGSSASGENGSGAEYGVWYKWCGWCCGFETESCWGSDKAHEVMEHFTEKRRHRYISQDESFFVARVCR